MAPKVNALKNEYEKDINFVFLNVDNQKWDNYIRKFQVNGIPQVNLFDRKANLISTFIGKQEEKKIRDSLDKIEKKDNSPEEILNEEFSIIKEKKFFEVTPRSHGWFFYQSRDFDTIGKLFLKIDLQFWAIHLCSSWVPCADLKWM